MNVEYVTLAGTKHCPVGYVMDHYGKCYGFLKEAKLWTEAEAKCNKLPQGHLASFNSLASINVTYLMGSGWKPAICAIH